MSDEPKDPPASPKPSAIVPSRMTRGRSATLTPQPIRVNLPPPRPTVAAKFTGPRIAPESRRDSVKNVAHGPTPLRLVPPTTHRVLRRELVDSTAPWVECVTVETYNEAVDDVLSPSDDAHPIGKLHRVMRGDVIISTWACIDDRGPLELPRSWLGKGTQPPTDVDWVALWEENDDAREMLRAKSPDRHETWRIVLACLAEHGQINDERREFLAEVTAWLDGGPRPAVVDTSSPDRALSNASGWSGGWLGSEPSLVATLDFCRAPSETVLRGQWGWRVYEPSDVHPAVVRREWPLRRVIEALLRDRT